MADSKLPSGQQTETFCGPKWFKVQICVSEQREAAERLARRLRQDGYNAFVVADDKADEAQ